MRLLGAGGAAQSRPLGIIPLQIEDMSSRLQMWFCFVLKELHRIQAQRATEAQQGKLSEGSKKALEVMRDEDMAIQESSGKTASTAGGDQVSFPLPLVASSATCPNDWHCNGHCGTRLAENEAEAEAIDWHLGHQKSLFKFLPYIFAVHIAYLPEHRLLVSSQK